MVLCVDCIRPDELVVSAVSTYKTCRRCGCFLDGAGHSVRTADSLVECVAQDPDGTHSEANA